MHRKVSTIMMLRPISIVITVLLITKATAKIDFKRCINEMTNGCSIPMNLPFPYKEVFLPACERHDICYRCGEMYNWTRKQCDNAFKANMLTLCKLKEDAKTEALGYSNSFWDKIRSVFKVAAAMAKWIMIKSGTLQHCMQGSDVYFKGVDEFGKENFGLDDIVKCKYPCAVALGDPRNVI